jgi:hypothetical protein
MNNESDQQSRPEPAIRIANRISTRLPGVAWAGVIVVAFLTLGTASLRANSTNFVSVSAKALTPGSTNTVQGIQTIAAPTASKINTTQILAWLAQDEYAENNYSAPNFPLGAQLAEVYDDNRW